MKRLLDVFVSLLVLILLLPVLVVVAVLIWSQDQRFPFYVASRVGQGAGLFKMVKFRSMVVSADKTKVDSTASDDPRITRLGQFIRRYKIDELPQLWNVLKGEMSLVGPRPNVERETRLYTRQEQGLLSVRPGITDLASIVFSDEGDILAGSKDPDLTYNQLIRPWKSALGLTYVSGQSGIGVDLRIILQTIMNSIDRQRALLGVSQTVALLGGDAELQRVSMRQVPLVPTPPPGATEIVQSRAPIAVAS